MSTLPQEVLELRKRAHSGGRIEEHRAFRRINQRRRITGSAAALTVAFTVMVMVMLPVFAQWWHVLLEFAAPAAGFTGEILLQQRTVLPFVTIGVPYLAAPGAMPDRALLTAVAFVTVALFGISLLVPRRFLPFIYLLRLALLIQAISIAYFALWAAHFPYTVARYTSDMLTVGLAIMALVPIIFGLTYFVFDFGLTRKVLIVALTIAHLLVFIPLQYLVHAVLVQWATLLFLPVLFMLFGLLPDVSVVIALYGWAMSWRDRAERVDVTNPVI